MAKTVRRKAPSRARYEQAHSTVSCRIPREVYDRLRAVKEAEGKSFADILKIGLGIIEVRVKEEGETRKQGYDNGYRKGYAEAERTYKVTYPCSVCRKTIELTSKEAKRAANQYMQQHGWGHKECHERWR